MWTRLFALSLKNCSASFQCRLFAYLSHIASLSTFWEIRSMGLHYLRKRICHAHHAVMLNSFHPSKQIWAWLRTHSSLLSDKHPDKQVEQEGAWRKGLWKGPCLPQGIEKEFRVCWRERKLEFGSRTGFKAPAHSGFCALSTVASSWEPVFASFLFSFS